MKVLEFDDGDNFQFCNQYLTPQFSKPLIHFTYFKFDGLDSVQQFKKIPKILLNQLASNSNLMLLMIFICCQEY